MSSDADLHTTVDVHDDRSETSWRKIHLKDVQQSQLDTGKKHTFESWSDDSEAESTPTDSSQKATNYTNSIWQNIKECGNAWLAAAFFITLWIVLLLQVLGYAFKSFMSQHATIPISRLLGESCHRKLWLWGQIVAVLIITHLYKENHCQCSVDTYWVREWLEKYTYEKFWCHRANVRDFDQFPIADNVLVIYSKHNLMIQTQSYRACPSIVKMKIKILSLHLHHQAMSLRAARERIRPSYRICDVCHKCHWAVCSRMANNKCVW